MILLIAIVVGALAGAAASGEGGALVGALLAWLIVRSLRQQREIEVLRKRVDAPVAGSAAERVAPGARCRARARTHDCARARRRAGARRRIESHRADSAGRSERVADERNA
jgi:hypothetical protein